MTDQQETETSNENRNMWIAVGVIVVLLVGGMGINALVHTEPAAPTPFKRAVLLVTQHVTRSQARPPRIPASAERPRDTELHRTHLMTGSPTRPVMTRSVPASRMGMARRRWT